MENASNALLIAGAVLLTMLILTVGISLYNTFSNTADQFVSKMDADEISKFNSNFDVFNGRSDITAQDIVTLYNLAEEYEKNSDIYVSINVIGTTNTPRGGTIEFLQSNSANGASVIYFECENITYDQDEGYVTSIEFKKIQ